ncbi:uncharacterized protein PGTG_15597 [Puccinia graminis f. sp. tritici CRL 75-36-700-3]|uniref:MCM AAA-lid domain-containing protein n=1 Tax=Puccinia graminis f. sp. tritici (strain CRL 75-36-700-3 / race SCCL) TaxID=418459 RepID=E3KZA9_PUCGT|nr:uncharacterized protein PGTG_15597 [Puccinia graminis f. sp. tritici CRL 75-36-700-3]EFP89634.1 hypothetical protein PGTG_15597 [Puccinia graminis f. sp. tritici CRL 75-36-700-3]
MLRKHIQYAREKIRPKLHQMDQDKTSKLFLEQRQESLSGLIAILVRHLESMIRMSEASAKLHLRDFIQCQKISIKKQLERGFRKYLTVADDHQELLGFLLGQVVKEKIWFHIGKLKACNVAQLSFLLNGLKRSLSRSLSSRNKFSPLPLPFLSYLYLLQQRKRMLMAKEDEIYDVRPFLKSLLFSTNGYSFQQHDQAGMIKSFDSNSIQKDWSQNPAANFVLKALNDLTKDQNNYSQLRVYGVAIVLDSYDE